LLFLMVKPPELEIITLLEAAILDKSRIQDKAGSYRLFYYSIMLRDVFRRIFLSIRAICTRRNHSRRRESGTGQIRNWRWMGSYVTIAAYATRCVLWKHPVTY
jgi:hypothetical protein